jgi:nucleotide-binding universal stress UspA family protein
MAFKHLLVPTDFSEPANNALSHAIDEAVLHQARPTTWPDGSSSPTARPRSSRQIPAATVGRWTRNSPRISTGNRGRAKEVPVTTFRRIKIQATVETAPTLLTEDQIAGALRALRDGLTQLEVSVVAIEAKEEPAVELPPSLEYRD